MMLTENKTLRPSSSTELQRDCIKEQLFECVDKARRGYGSNYEQYSKYLDDFEIAEWIERVAGIPEACLQLTRAEIKSLGEDSTVFDSLIGGKRERAPLKEKAETREERKERYKREIGTIGMWLKLKSGVNGHVVYSAFSIPGLKDYSGKPALFIKDEAGKHHRVLPSHIVETDSERMLKPSELYEEGQRCFMGRKLPKDIIIYDLPEIEKVIIERKSGNVTLRLILRDDISSYEVSPSSIGKVW